MGATDVPGLLSTSEAILGFTCGIPATPSQLFAEITRQEDCELRSSNCGLKHSYELLPRRRFAIRNSKSAVPPGLLKFEYTNALEYTHAQLNLSERVSPGVVFEKRRFHPNSSG
jgi:hypothetical protein